MKTHNISLKIIKSCSLIVFVCFFSVIFITGYPFNPCLTEAQYKEMEEKVQTTLSGLEGELKGKFYPLTGMDKGVQQQLIDDHFLFKEGDRFLQAANAW